MPGTSLPRASASGPQNLRPGLVYNNGMSIGLDLAQLTSAASLNRVRFVGVPGLPLLPDLLGRTAFESAPHGHSTIPPRFMVIAPEPELA